ncbi:hypothetical protein, partial [Methylobacterium gregans]|uniref:hypothetical protein n=1 Tax=Methylobacterium gregans TaxID=374424 RepID=UPI0024E0A0A1
MSIKEGASEERPEARLVAKEAAVISATSSQFGGGRRHSSAIADSLAAEAITPGKGRAGRAPRHGSAGALASGSREAATGA